MGHGGQFFGWKAVRMQKSDRGVSRQGRGAGTVGAVLWQVHQIMKPDRRLQHRHIHLWLIQRDFAGIGPDAGKMAQIMRAIRRTRRPNRRNMGAVSRGGRAHSASKLVAASPNSRAAPKDKTGLSSPRSA